MTPVQRVVTLTPEDPCSKILTLVEESTHYGFPVITPDNVLVGLLPERFERVLG
jgi:predicted transcriptional regulator